MKLRAWILLPLALLTLLPGSSRAGAFVRILVDPPEIPLRSAGASYTLLIHGQAADGRQVDLGRKAHYQSADKRIAVVSETGVVRAVGDGRTTIRIEVEGQNLQATVLVEGTASPRKLSLISDIVPLLSRFGCNSSGCHGKAEGQNGFKLSVFGFDPAADYTALIKEGRGRRVFAAAPEESLLLRKMSGQTPHGGGVRIPSRTSDYDTVRSWIAAGAPFGNANDPVVTSVRVEPRERILGQRQEQQLRVMAHYSDGRQIDVTGHARFQSNNPGLADVLDIGVVRSGDVPGEAAIMVSFMNEMDVFRAVIPRAGTIDPYPAPPENNFVDRLVFQKLRKLNLVPSDLTDDATFLRRVYLDVIGMLPTPAETRRFLEDPNKDRRARLVDQLLLRPEFADYWALQWADLLRVDRQVLGAKRAQAYYRWIRSRLEMGQPLDRFAREILTAEGFLSESAPASFFKVLPKSGEAASTWAQVFLGVRIACAECHHHPFDRWSQTDYYGMQAFFTGLSIRPSAQGEALLADAAPPTRHPRTGEEIFPYPLGEKMPTAAPSAQTDRRAQLADWLTRPDNPFFARNLANRVWAHLLGRGLIEPVDDARATNPPSNPELLDALARHLIDSKYDLRTLIRTITASRVYQLSSTPNATNERDEQNYSRALLKRVPAEVLFDMVCQTTGVPERFAGLPLGARAVQVWDSKVSHYFLKVFGRPERISACECERNGEPSVAQVLHLLNSSDIQEKLSHEAGTIARLVQRQPDDGALVEEMYLTFYSRRPDEDERNKALAYLGRNKDRRKAAEDLGWSLLNSLEFVFNH